MTSKRAADESNFYYARDYELVSSRALLLSSSINDKVRRIIVPRKWISGRFVALFNKPAGDIVCPHFWELKPFKGCPYQCVYCYLQGTFYGDKSAKLKDLDKMAEDLRKFLSWATDRGLKVLLNAGETTDSLAVPEWTEKFLNKVLPILEKYKYHKILLLSKAGTKNIQPLLDVPKELRKYLIVSFSVNPPIISEKYEIGTAPPLDRLKAAKILQEEGYTIRVRIDPIIPVEGWRAYYCILIKVILEDFKLHPEVITIGSLRGLKKTIKYATDKSWTKYFEGGERTRWGLKIKRVLRFDMYRIILEKLKSMNYNGHVALCKETLEMWKELSKLGLICDPGTYGVWENVKCNCKL